MSGRSSQNKGKRGERELSRELAKLGIDVERTGYQQAKNGGFDLTMPNCAIEVKRYSSIRDGHISVFWKQTVAQSKEFGTVGVLAYREDNQAWRVMVPGSYHNDKGVLTLIPDQKYAWTLTVDGFVVWYKSTLANDGEHVRRLTVNG